MVAADLLRSSRDGDQFHYYWGARHALALLRPGTDLVAISVEGSSSGDAAGGGAGEQVIDLADYYGSAVLAKADRVVYRQLKHSTTRPNEPWSASGLVKTLIGFADKFRQVRDELPGAEDRLQFEFVSNRPLGASVRQALDELALGSDSAGRDAAYLRRKLGFGADRAGEALFCGLVVVDDTALDLFRLEQALGIDVRMYLPGSAGGEASRLKEIVERRATSLEKDQTITRATVLSALGATDDQMFPAPNLIRPPDELVPTESASRVAAELAGPAMRTGIVHAAGGIGKSVFAAHFGRRLPDGSLTLVYDCFGDGGYRRSSSPRHAHQQGLVQLSNELAAQGLCDPLVPLSTASSSDYMKVFLVRVQRAAGILAETRPDALLALVIDAADNAVMAAAEMGERTFVTDLLTEEYPPNVRVALLCRTERIDLLKPPPATPRFELAGFELADTRQRVESVYGPVSGADAEEFHRRTSGNPRIQTVALETSAGEGLESCLRALGEPQPGQSASAQLDSMLRARIEDCKYRRGLESAGLERVCEAIAVLRPRVPIRIVAELCEVPESLVRSFASDIGGALLVDGDALQFRDEPTETFFRAEYRPAGKALTSFIERLTPLASAEAYAALSLPQLLWEAGKVAALVDLALSDAALPDESELEHRQIAQQRSQYALKATLRRGMDLEAARLAVRAGVLTSGRHRWRELLRRNTDLAGAFLDPQTVEEVVASRGLLGSWPGSNLPYEGALLSAAAGQSSLARSRLRSAQDWMYAWCRVEHPSVEDRISDDDIAEVALGLLNLEGPAACSRYLSRWRPPVTRYDAGRIVANRLAAAGRLDELQQLGLAGGIHVQLAVAAASWRHGVVCDARLARRMARAVRKRTMPLPLPRNQFDLTVVDRVAAATWIAAMGLRHDELTSAKAQQVLQLNLPTTLSHWAGGDFDRDSEVVLCGHALMAQVSEVQLDVGCLEPATVREHRQERHVHYTDVSSYDRNIPPLAAWAAQWTALLSGGAMDATSAFDSAAAGRGLPAPSRHENDTVLIAGALRIGARILAAGASPECSRRYLDWCEQARQHLRRPCLIDAVRITSGAPDLDAVTARLADWVRASLNSTHENADEKTSDMIALARAVQRFSPSEAGADFDRAIELTDRVGDDCMPRWDALLATASAAAGPAFDDRRAYRVAQVVEGLEPYLNDYLDFEGGLAAVARLSPTVGAAVASRWRDRDTCGEEVFAAVYTADGGPLRDAPTTSLALAPLSDRVGAFDLLERAIRQATPSSGRRIAQAFGEFIRHRSVTASRWRRLDHLATEVGLDLDGTPLARNSDMRPPICAAAALSRRRDGRATHIGRASRLSARRTVGAFWQSTTTRRWRDGTKPGRSSETATSTSGRTTCWTSRSAWRRASSATCSKPSSPLQVPTCTTAGRCPSGSAACSPSRRRPSGSCARWRPSW